MLYCLEFDKECDEVTDEECDDYCDNCMFCIVDNKIGISSEESEEIK